MKRSIFFWPVVSAVAVFLLWLVICLFMIGIPGNSPSPEAFSFPAWRLLGRSWSQRSYRQLTWYFENVVTSFWRVAPFCRPSRRSHSHSWQVAEDVSEPLTIYLPSSVRLQKAEGMANYLRSKGRPQEVVLFGPSGRFDPYSPRIFGGVRRVSGYEVLSHGEVLLYVFLLPGIHFGGAAFMLAFVVALLVRLPLAIVGPKAASGNGQSEEPEES